MNATDRVSSNRSYYKKKVRGLQRILRPHETDPELYEGFGSLVNPTLKVLKVKKIGDHWYTVEPHPFKMKQRTLKAVKILAKNHGYDAISFPVRGMTQNIIVVIDKRTGRRNPLSRAMTARQEKFLEDLAGSSSINPKQRPRKSGKQKRRKSIAGKMAGEKRDLTDLYLDDMMNAFRDPIVWDKYAKGWETDFPKKLLQLVIPERLAENAQAMSEHRLPTGTDIEAFAYLYTATSGTPVGREVANVYEYLFRKYMNVMNVTNIPDWVPTKLSKQEQEMLRKLKRDIYSSRLKIRELRQKNKPMPDNYVGPVGVEVDYGPVDESDDE